MNASKKHLLLIFGIALFLRCILFGVVLWSGVEVSLTTDGTGYLQLAENIIEHSTFSRTAGGETLVSDSNRTPTYPVFIALFQLLGGGITWVLIAQILVSSLSCVFTSKIATRLFPNNGFAWLSGLLLTIDVPSIVSTNLVLTETLFTFLILLSFYLIFRKEKPSALLFAIAGLLFGASALCRPIGILLPFVLLGFGQKLGWKNTTTLCIATALAVAPWFIRNTVVFGRPFSSTISEINLLLHTGASIRSEREQKSTLEVQQEIMLELEKAHKWQGNESDIIPFMDYCRTEGWKEIQKSPLIFAKQSLVAFISFLVKPERGFIKQLTGANPSHNDALTGRSKMDSNGMLNRFFQESNRVTLTLVFVQLLVHLFVLICCWFGLLYLWKIEIGAYYCSSVSLFILDWEPVLRKILHDLGCRQCHLSV